MKSKAYSIQIILIFVISVLVSCGQKKAEWEGTIEEVDGVTTVKNPKEPSFGGEVLRVEEELSIGEAEGREEYMFSQVNDVEADETGRLYVLDSKEANVKVFDRNGDYIKTIGRKGQGPGELQMPNDIYVDSKGRLYISDVWNDRLSVFNIQGIFLGSSNFEEYSVGKIVGVNNQDEIILIMNKTSKESGKDFLVFDYLVNVYSPQFTFKESLYSTTIPIMQHFTKQGSRLALSIPFQKTLCCTIDSWGNAYLADSQEYKIQVFSPDGKLIQQIEKEHERRKVLKQDVEDYYNEHFIQEDENERKFWSDTVKDQLKIPEYKPVFHSFYFDQEKLLVLGDARDHEKNTSVDIFDSEGKYIGRTLINVLPKMWLDNKIYALEEDEEGYQVVKRYKVTWKI
jgi:sugar lactone lactonase YvrE